LDEERAARPAPHDRRSQRGLLRHAGDAAGLPGGDRRGPAWGARRFAPARHRRQKPRRRFARCRPEAKRGW